MDYIGVFLSKESREALYVQLYKYLVSEIRSGGIAAGEKLPGKRTAASQLGVSVNTVDEAYQMLAAEGYVTAKARSGFVVRALGQQLPQSLWPTATKEAATLRTPAAGPISGGWQYSFSSGGLEPELFPLKTWGRLLREVLATTPDLFVRGDAAGEGALRDAVARYLCAYRGARCTAEQVVVGAGLEVLVGMLVRLLHSEVFALEQPGYPKTARILQNMGAEHRNVLLDGFGMKPDALLRSGASVAYLTPSHQFPTGAVMPADRRSEMLNWAAGGSRLIVEDDHDSEFRFNGRPIPCLQGMDEGGRVVYSGTFTRALAPGLRAAYLVLPPAVLAQWKTAYGDYACTVGRAEQYTLARFLDEGHFARSLNRSRTAYRLRRDALMAALQSELAHGSYSVENLHTGLFCILRLHGQNALQLADKLRRSGILIHALNEYFTHPKSATQSTANALVLGYGALEADSASSAVKALALHL